MQHDSLRINGQRLWQSIMEMAAIGSTKAGGCRRLALGDEDRTARDLFRHWCEQAGCEVTIDQLGNMYARRAGLDAELPPVAAGSHLDTQPHGGKFDGAFGVLAALEVMRTLNDAGVQTDAPLEVVNWSNEEGARFAPAMLCSGVYAGVFTAHYALARRDEDGLRFGDELQRIDYAGVAPCSADVHQFAAFLEAHIEQGPVLERHGEIIGIVTGGQGQRWYDLSLHGQDAHAGSTPMDARQDALAAGAAMVVAVEDIARATVARNGHGVATVGAVRVFPNSRNTIAGRVVCSVDVRHPDEHVLAQMGDELASVAERIAKARGVQVELEEIWHNPLVTFDAQCIAAVQEATDMLGLAHRTMSSGAGHDTCQICRAVPAAMIFVPCAGGISHNEAESAEPQHLEAGCNVLLHAMLQLACPRSLL